MVTRTVIELPEGTNCLKDSFCPKTMFINCILTGEPKLCFHPLFISECAFTKQIFKGYFIEKSFLGAGIEPMTS